MSNKSGRIKDYPCLRCAKHVKKTDYAIKCALCDIWVHKICENMDDATFKVLNTQQDQTGQCFWSCQSCHSYALKFEKRMREVDKRLVALEEKLPTVEKTVTAAQTEIAQVKLSVNQLKDSAGDIQKSTTMAVFNEIRERESRQTNLVIHNLPEPEQTVKDAKERIAKDMEKLQELCGVIEANVDAPTVFRFAKRLGERSKTGDHCRPLLLGFKSVEGHDKVLQNAPKLAEMDEPWSSVNIVQDITAMQRSEEKQMREEANKKNSELTKDEAENWVWKVVGRRGERCIVKVSREKDQHRLQKRANAQSQMRSTRQTRSTTQAQKP